MRRGWMALIVLGALAGGGAVIHHKYLRWKKFDVVRDGVLYRSGLLKEWQLKHAVRRFGIKTVFSFTYGGHDAEDRVCQDLGIKRHFHYLPGDGVGPDDPYLRFLEVMSDPGSHPVLVHCSAGVQRTGGAVALYRTLIEGWRFEDAIREMIAKGNEGRPDQIQQLRSLYETLSWAKPDIPAPTSSKPLEVIGKREKGAIAR